MLRTPEQQYLHELIESYLAPLRSEIKELRQQLSTKAVKNNPVLPLVSTRELLSDYAHEAWCGWMKYMFSKAEINEDGTWTMPKWAVERWQRQMNTKYNDLPEEEKKSDREEADKMLSIFHGC